MPDDSRPEPRPPRRPITWLFNLGLLTYLICVLGFEMLLEPEEMPSVPLDRFFESAPVLTVVGVSLFVIAAFTFAVVITLAFWNRFLTDVFKVRSINAAEAVALNLVIAIFFAPA
ncbi:MAG TPA: hypothetical protein VGN72_05285 [Tepidisphaeraceae bacterium]|jgi:hypothetical protein|nr:hypothetical protein [Tepidisphaeraceae bacterium]